MPRSPSRRPARARSPRTTDGKSPNVPRAVASERALANADAEPAARFLPADEQWGEDTWYHFRLRLLKHLKTHGAASLADLKAAPPSVLWLPLNEAELLASLESARRRQYVQPLGHERSASGRPTDEEWVLSDAAVRLLRGNASWMSDNLKDTGKVVGTLATVAAAVFGAGKVAEALADQGEEVSIGIAVVIVIGLVALVRRIIATGNRAWESAARDWRRFQRERPVWYAIAQEDMSVWARYGLQFALPAGWTIWFMLQPVTSVPDLPSDLRGPPGVTCSNLLGFEVPCESDPWVPIIVIVVSGLCVTVFCYKYVRWWRRWRRIETLAKEAASGPVETP
jgi:hypothetical protein